MWNSNNSYVAVPSPTVAVMVEAPRQSLVSSAQPVFGRLTIQAMDGQIDIVNSLTTLLPAGTVVDVQLAIGIYIGQFDDATNLYTQQDPSSPADASRYDWLYLENRGFNLVTAGAFSVSQSFAAPVNSVTIPKVFDLTKVDFQQDIGQGEALMLAYTATSVFAPTNLSILLRPNVRAFLTRGT